MYYLEAFLLNTNNESEPNRPSVAKVTVLTKLSTIAKPVFGNSFALVSFEGACFELHFVFQLCQIVVSCFG